MSTSELRLFSRREFMRSSIGVVAVTATIPSFLDRTAMLLAGPATAPVASALRDGRILVVVQLSGGNDGLNTVIPYPQDGYHKARRTLAVAADKVLRIDDQIGLHPNLAPLKNLYDSGKLAIVQGVGYPNPDRSHFRSMEIWHSAEPENFVSTGWIGRMFDHTCGNQHLKEAPSPTLGVSIGEVLEPALRGNLGIGVALRDPEAFYSMTQLATQVEVETGTKPQKVGPAAALDFLRRTALNAELSADRIRRSVRGVQSKSPYPQEPFAQGLKLVAGMIAGGMNTQVYYVSLGGFDTHANQKGPHERLLKALADGIGAFQTDIEALGQADRVVGFTFSEFGRRVAENGSGGTDHGQAAPMFIFGAPVKGGVIGGHPSLEKLNGGDLMFHADFRQVYATVLDQWLRTESDAILGGKFDGLPFLKTARA